MHCSGVAIVEFKQVNASWIMFPFNPLENIGKPVVVEQGSIGRGLYNISDVLQSDSKNARLDYCCFIRAEDERAKAIIQLTFTCSKSIIETLGKGVKYVQS